MRYEALTPASNQLHVQACDAQTTTAIQGEMYIPQESDSVPASDEMVEGKDCSASDLTKVCSSEPIQIILYPPKNTQFRFDGTTSTIEVEPVIPRRTDLTPLVEKCNIFGDDSDRLQNQKCQYRDDEYKVEEIVKIERVFEESKLKRDCFLKGCKWSGDGLCLLSNSEDNILRLFEVPESVLAQPRDDIEPVLQMKEGGTVYDYVWYPKMNSLDPVSCVFACTSQDSPIHLWDAYTGQLRATYQPINQYDEVTSAYSLSFSPDGCKLYSGFKKCLRVFDISQPGRVSEERNLKVKGNSVFQSNIISSIAVNPVLQTLYALGSYDKTIGLYTEPEGDLLCILKGHSGGVTQILFSTDGNHLFSGGRKDNEILCWDVRNPGKIVFSIQRRVDTQQKMLFDLSPDQTYLITGTTDSCIRIHNIKAPLTSENVLPPSCTLRGHEDCVNGVQFHPSLSIFASASGQRHLPRYGDEEQEREEEEEMTRTIENTIKIWSFNRLSPG